VHADTKTSPSVSLIGGEHELVRQFRLEVISGPDQGAKYLSRGERTVVGSARSNDVVLRDTTVSRFHCQIAISDGKAIVRDLGSRNGTRINGVWVHEAMLTGDAVLELGSTKIRFELGDSHLQLPLSAEDRFGMMVGRSKPMRRVFSVLQRAAQNDATVLLLGETGTGKDAAAMSIHEASARRDRPFVVVDCGAISPLLLESELFGHERGSFTGATDSRVGAFQAASGGTLFLDEIGELRADLQPKLLRAIESRTISPVGSNLAVPVDVRIIAATNRDLHVEMNDKHFRTDLYYRLAVLEVHMPPLRECLEDLPLLVSALVAGLDGPENSEILQPAALEELAQHRWPGNVRELRNYVERRLALGSAVPLPGPSIPVAAPDVDIRVPLKVARQRYLEAFERSYLERLLAVHGNNVSAAARAAGVDRVHLHRLLARAGLR